MNGTRKNTRPQRNRSPVEAHAVASRRDVPSEQLHGVIVRGQLPLDRWMMPVVLARERQPSVARRKEVAEQHDGHDGHEWPEPRAHAARLHDGIGGEHRTGQAEQRNREEVARAKPYLTRSGDKDDGQAHRECDAGHEGAFL